MKKRLYHGSQFIIQKPEYGKGARHNDYGKGFAPDYSNTTMIRTDRTCERMGMCEAGRWLC